MNFFVRLFIKEIQFVVCMIRLQKKKVIAVNPICLREQSSAIKGKQMHSFPDGLCSQSNHLALSAMHISTENSGLCIGRVANNLGSTATQLFNELLSESKQLGDLGLEFKS